MTRRRSKCSVCGSRPGTRSNDIGRAVAENRLSFSFLDAPSIRGMPRVDTTYEDFAATAITRPRLDTEALRALGLEAPGPAAQMREGEADVLDLLAMLMATGASEDAVLRLFRVYADALRRLGLAEAEFFEAEIKRRHEPRAPPSNSSSIWESISAMKWSRRSKKPSLPSTSGTDITSGWITPWATSRGRWTPPGWRRPRPVPRRSPSWISQASPASPRS